MRSVSIIHWVTTSAVLIVYEYTFDGFKNRWLPPVPLVYPQPAGFFSEGVFADEKKTSGSAIIDASRLIFQSTVSFSKPLGSLSNPLRCDNIFQI